MPIAYFLWHYLTHPREAFTLTLVWLKRNTNLLNTSYKRECEDWNWCCERLNAISTNFSTIILQLSENLRVPFCIFYLILRGLDSIEDDTKQSVVDKKKQLIEFYTHLKDSDWKLYEYGSNMNERELLEHFHRVIHCFLELKVEYRETIIDISRRMGEGMAEFLDRSIDTLQDWNNYTYHVSSILMHGILRIWMASDPENLPLMYFENNKTLIFDPEIVRVSTSLGHFLQKGNIIKDILEDISEDPPRVFWPREVRSKYVDRIQDIVPQINSIKSDGFNQEKSVACLNELVQNAMEHVPDAIEYVKMYWFHNSPNDVPMFRFVGLAFLTYIATLEVCYDNPEVFTSGVKMCKGEAFRIFCNVGSFETFIPASLVYIRRILQKSKIMALENRQFDFSDAMIKQTSELIELCRRHLSDVMNTLEKIMLSKR